MSFVIFFFNDTATTEIYTLSLHDALPIYPSARPSIESATRTASTGATNHVADRSEEHTSELQSQSNLVCRLLLEKKIIIIDDNIPICLLTRGIYVRTNLHVFVVGVVRDT